ncbi:MAG: GGDEF domain-containing response regulator [Candidatus Aminicenantes bacterium]|nr:GGDEF domain-containing response regulator [Candidatus Aminicenantes bacterium]
MTAQPLKPQNIDVIRVLLIEDNPGDARLIREMLSEAEDFSFFLECIDRISTSFERLSEEDYDVILLDLSLPDSHGFETFTKIHSQQPDVPIIVLTGIDDKNLGRKAVQKGAQDYLVKGRVEPNLLSRSILYAIDRQRMIKRLRSLSLKDNLTGLFNRRGFLSMAEQQLRMADRLGGEMVLFFADFDNLKDINDSLGHHHGDLALIEIAEILRTTFRQSDIIGRIGGDEFAILIIKSSKMKAEILVQRLEEKLVYRNAEKGRKYTLSLSIGMSLFDPKKPQKIHELLNLADREMYEQKRSKK